MKASSIILFLVTVVCAFFIAGTAFAGYTNRDHSDRSGIAVGMNGVPAIHDQDAGGQGTGMWDAASRLFLTQAEPGTRYSLLDHSTEMFKVISVLRTRVRDEKLLKKIVQKLPDLSNKRLRIMVSLSERMSAADQSGDKDFAFLLLTTMIVFS